MRAWLLTWMVCGEAQPLPELIHAVRPGYCVYCDVGAFVVFAHHATNPHNTRYTNSQTVD
jgi:hypothetical protein